MTPLSRVDRDGAGYPARVRAALCGLLVSITCACDAPQATPPVEAPAAPPAAPAAPPARPPAECALGEPEVVIDGARERGSLAVAPSREGALVVLASGGELVTRALSGQGRPRGAQRRAPVRGLDALLALEPRGERHLLIGRGSCPESAHCLLAIALDRGAPLGAPVAAALPEPIRTLRRAASRAEDAPVFLAWSTTGGHRGLERFVLDGGLGRARVPLGTEPASEEAPVEILGLAADGDRWAAVWRRGPTEAVQSSVLLTDASAHVAVDALHDALAIDAIELSGDALALIATFEFSRPHHVRLRLGRPEPEHARELAAGAPLPAPFEARERAELEHDDQGLWLRRRDAAGDPVGSRVLLAAGAVESAAVARLEGALLVAWQETGSVRARTVRCEGVAARASTD